MDNTNNFPHVGVKIAYLRKEEDKLKNKFFERTVAICNVYFGEPAYFMVHGVCLVEPKDEEDELQLFMPSHKVFNKFKTPCHPVSKEFSDFIKVKALEAYREALKAEPVIEENEVNS